jgi:hypothetical protein
MTERASKENTAFELVRTRSAFKWDRRGTHQLDSFSDNGYSIIRQLFHILVVTWKSTVVLCIPPFFLSPHASVSLL